MQSLAMYYFGWSLWRKLALPRFIGKAKHFQIHMDFFLLILSKNLIGCSFLKVKSQTVWMNFYHYIKIHWSNLCFEWMWFCNIIHCCLEKNWLTVELRDLANIGTFHLYNIIIFVSIVYLMRKTCSIETLSGSQRMCE